MQGIMLQPSAALAPGKEGALAHVRLWCHETLRVFYDRLVDLNDQEWLLGTIKEATKRHFDADFDALFAHLDAGTKGSVDVQDVRSCIFGDYMDPSVRGDEAAERQPYAEIRDTERLIGVLDEYLTEHNGLSKRPMNLAMFLFAAEHISRICRVLRQPRGHLLLAGVGGSGRQSLSRLAAFISEMEVFQIEVTKNYTLVEWREDLKKMLRRSGGEGRQSVFLFSDTQIKDEAFVEDINNILNSGEVRCSPPEAGARWHLGFLGECVFGGLRGVPLKTLFLQTHISPRCPTCSRWTSAWASSSWSASPLRRAGVRSSRSSSSGPSSPSAAGTTCTSSSASRPSAAPSASAFASSPHSSTAAPSTGSRRAPQPPIRPARPCARGRKHLQQRAAPQGVPPPPAPFKQRCAHSRPIICRQTQRRTFRLSRVARPAAARNGRTTRWRQWPPSSSAAWSCSAGRRRSSPCSARASTPARATPRCASGPSSAATTT